MNTSFGLKSGKKNHIQARTIQRYVKNLDFTVKNCSSTPPNRNNIGIRIFRVV